MSLSSWCAKAAPGSASARTMHGSDASTRGATPPTLAIAYVAALAFIGSAHEAHEHVERAAVAAGGPVTPAMASAARASVKREREGGGDAAEAHRQLSQP